MSILRSEINSNFYQIVAIDENGLPIYVLPEYVANANVSFAENSNVANTANNALSLTSDLSNVSISGGLNGYILETNGEGTLSWVPQVSTPATQPAGSNTSIQFNDDGSFGANAGFSFNKITGIFNAPILAGDGYLVSNITAANATYATTAGTANSVDVANVAGIGNIATINLDGNVSNVLTGDGTWVELGGGDVANANYANFAGTAYSVSAANISGTINLANYATVANSVAVANVSGIGNIATINLDGNVSNVLAGNGTWVELGGGDVANANYANFAGQVVSSSQGNITSVGVLTGLSVTGNANTGNIQINGTTTFNGNISSISSNVETIYIEANSFVQFTSVSDTVTFNGANGVDIYSGNIITMQGVGNGVQITGNLSTGNILTDGYCYANGDPVSFGGGNVFTDITVNNSILLDGITIANTGNIFTAEIITEGSNVNVATSTALVELVNFTSSTIVQNNLGNITLTTTGSDWSLNDTQVKFGPWSWYCVTGTNNDNSFLTEDISIGDLSTSTNYTIDMWVYVDGGAPTDNYQTLFSGGRIDGSSDSSVTMWLNGGNNKLSFEGSLGVSGANESTNSLNNDAWNHVGFMFTDSKYYFLINGIAEEFTPNTTVAWPSTALRFLSGGAYSYPQSFARGYIANIRISKTYCLFPVVAGTYSLPVSTDYNPTGNVTIVTPGSTTNALDYSAIGNVPQNLYPNSNVTFNSLTLTEGVYSLNAAGAIQSSMFTANSGGAAQLQMGSGDAVFNISGSNVLWINGTPGSSGLKFPDGSIQYTSATAPTDFSGNTVTANIITANTSLTVGNILLENNGSNILSITNSYETTGNVSLPISTVMTELFNFDTTTVQNDLGNVSLTTTGSDWSLSTSELKYGNYSWYNITSGTTTNFFRGDINVNSMNSSTDWTIDMYVYFDSTGDTTTTTQTLVNGTWYGSGPYNIWMGVDGSTGTVYFYADGNPSTGSTRYDIGTMSTGSWYHIGLMRTGSVLYSLFNGSIAPVSGNPSVSFPNDTLQFLGGGGGGGSLDCFALGYATNMRISPDYALFTDVSGSYTLPVSSDYDPTGNITVTGTVTITTNAAPPAWSTITNDSANLANITGTVGSVVAVTDGGGKLAYWDTTNSRWSYVFDNSAV